MSHHPRRKTLSLAVLVLAAVLALVACSSTGGKPRSSDSGMAAGTADTPRVTIAMVTHGVPGNAFWDIVRKGAETAAAKDNIELRYSADPEAPNRPISSRRPSTEGGRHRGHPRQAGCAWHRRSRRRSRPAYPSSASTPASTAWKNLGVQQYFGQDESVAGERVGERAQRTDGAKKVLCIIHEQGNVSLESRCAGVGRASRAPWRTAQREQQRHAVGGGGDHGQAAAGSSIDHIIALDASFALTAVQSRRPRAAAVDRHLRHERRVRQRDQERRHRLGSRSAAVPPGLPGHRLPVAVHQQPQPHRRRNAGAHRPGIRRQDQHRRHRGVRRQRHPLVRRACCAAPASVPCRSCSSVSRRRTPSAWVS